MKHFIFDFDGVIADSMPVWAGIYVNLLSDNGLAVPTDMVKEITPLGNSGAAKYCVEHGLKMSHSKALNYALTQFKKAYATTIKIKNNVKSTLEQLHKSGIRLHVLTASSHSYLDAFLKKEGVWELFDNVWSTDDFSLVKSDTKIYTEVAKKLGVNLCDCTFFDDNIIALSTAAKAGMTTIGVYDKSSDCLEQQIREITNGYIYDFSQIKY